MKVCDMAIIKLTLINDTFLEDLNESGFQLNNAPEGLTVMYCEQIDDSTVLITLGFDYVDFDNDITDFSITALAEILSGGTEVTTQAITIEAMVEQ